MADLPTKKSPFNVYFHENGNKVGEMTHTHNKDEIMLKYQQEVYPMQQKNIIIQYKAVCIGSWKGILR